MAAVRPRFIVRGDREIMANMRRVRGSIGGRALDDIVISALSPMRQSVENNARNLRQVGYNPPGGHLDEGVVIAKITASSPYSRVYWISLAKRARKIGHLVEFGTAPHWQPRRGIMHPGARPKPFFRPAFEENKNSAGSIVARAAWARIQASLIGVIR